MNCAQFQEILPEVIDGGRNAEQEAHLQTCPVCSGLVADLNLITSEAPQLQEFADPAPRVWNSIEIALRQEGLIREPRSGRRCCRRSSDAGVWAGWRRSPRWRCLHSESSFTREDRRERHPVAQLPLGCCPQSPDIQTARTDNTMTQRRPAIAGSGRLHALHDAGGLCLQPAECECLHSGCGRVRSS